MKQKNYTDTVKPDNNKNNASKTIQSVEISARILNVLANSNSSLALREIASGAQMSRSQAHRYLASFVNTGLVVHKGALGHYDLGPLALRLGLSAYAKLDVSNIASRYLNDLVDKTNLTGLITVWGPEGPTIIKWVHGRPATSTSLGLGSVLSLLTSTAGQVFLSYSPENLIENVLAKELKMSSSTHSDVEKIKEQVRKRGYSVVHDRVVRGLSAVSVPILNAQGGADLALGLVSRDPSIFKYGAPTLKHIIEKAKQASKDNGFYAGNNV